MHLATTTPPVGGTNKLDDGDRVRAGIFLPALVSVTTGGMGREVTIFYHRLGDLLAHRNTLTYSNILVVACLDLQYIINGNIGKRRVFL